MDKPTKSGLQDGKHVILECAACGKPLADIWNTRPNLMDPSTGKPFEWKIRAECPYCEDRSFVEKIHGGFHIGFIAKVNPDNYQDEKQITKLRNIRYEDNGVVVVEVDKC